MAKNKNNKLTSIIVNETDTKKKLRLVETVLLTERVCECICIVATRKTSENTIAPILIAVFAVKKELMISMRFQNFLDNVCCIARVWNVEEFGIDHSTRRLYKYISVIKDARNETACFNRNIFDTA